MKANIRSAAASTPKTATRCLPKGPGAALEGMLAGTRVLTLEGAFPVEYLTIGDRVVTRAGAARVTGIKITVVQNARVVRIAHHTLGLDTPQDDVTLAAAQRLLPRCRRAQRLFGAEDTVVCAQSLTDGAYIVAATLPEARFFTLTFATPTLIYAGGLLLACGRTPLQA